MKSLVQPLFDGPLDIVGDVHGEIAPLRSLMKLLGYNTDGVHPDGRRLVFVGDLTDRGPDSPAVVELVQRLLDAELAQCVLGNHDLNILLNLDKHDNGWFYGKKFVTENGFTVPQVIADEATRQNVLRLFRKLPIALERDDLRVVHAGWNDEMIQVARQSDDAAALFCEHRDRIENSFCDQELNKTDCELRHQNENAVKTLTSGPERHAKTPRKINGEIRRTERVHWWPEYRGPFCVFGHYSLPDGDPRIGGAAHCVDYGVAKRWTERRDGKTDGFNLKLAALRWPERELVFDEGESRKI